MLKPKVHKVEGDQVGKIVSISLARPLAAEWSHYICLLASNYILLNDEEEDSLCWSKNPRIGEYTTKLGYNVVAEATFSGEKCWWWGSLWKLQERLKRKISLWIVLNNKFLTWENGLKQGWIGLSFCVLCKSNEDSCSHLFMCFPYTEKVLSLVFKKFQAHVSWIHKDLNDSFRTWLNDKQVQQFQAFPCSLVNSIWWA
jgi:hypothetical protein